MGTVYSLEGWLKEVIDNENAEILPNGLLGRKEHGRVHMDLVVIEPRR